MWCISMQRDRLSSHGCRRCLGKELLLPSMALMRVLIINKFLYPNGGSETYIFKLGEALEQHGHEVQYFGMEHEGRCVGNRVNAYTSDMDFHLLDKVGNPYCYLDNGIIVKLNFAPRGGSTLSERVGRCFQSAS